MAEDEEVAAQTAVGEEEDGLRGQFGDMNDEEDGVSDDDEVYNNNTRDSSPRGQKQQSVQNIDEQDEERAADMRWMHSVLSTFLG